MNSINEYNKAVIDIKSALLAILASDRLLDWDGASRES